MLLTGRERDFLARYAYPAMSATEGAISGQDIDEFTRVYSRPNGFGGAIGLYRSMLTEGEEIKQIVAQQQLTMPVLAVGAGTGQFTYTTMAQVAQNVTEAKLDGIGHLAAVEDPEALARTLLDFYRTLDA
jgi:pimeloyl-ACP methyl ester carboxylesterase